MLYCETQHSGTAEGVIEGMARGFEAINQPRVVLMVEPHRTQQEVKTPQKLNCQTIEIRRNRCCPGGFLAGAARRRLRGGFRWFAMRKLSRVFGAHGWILCDPDARAAFHTCVNCRSTPLPTRRTLSKIRCSADYQIALGNHTLQAIKAETAAYVSIVRE